MPADEDELDQYSDESRTRLQAVAAAFGAAIEQHTARLLELGGGSGQVLEVFELHDTLRRAAASWDDAVFDHTGTFPLAIQLDEDDDDRDDDDDDAEEDAPSEVFVSVVSRWDVDVTSVEEVVAAGREAHRRINPDDSEDDALVRIGYGDVGQALLTRATQSGSDAAMPRRYADASWRDKPAKVVTSIPDPGTGQVTVDRVLVDEDRPELGWEWNAQWLDPPGRPPGYLAIGDYTTRVSSRSGSREMVLSTLAETPALEFLIRSRLVQGGAGDDWVPLPPLEQVREL